MCGCVSPSRSATFNSLHHLNLLHYPGLDSWRQWRKLHQRYKPFFCHLLKSNNFFLLHFYSSFLSTILTQPLLSLFVPYLVHLASFVQLSPFTESIYMFIHCFPHFLLSQQVSMCVYAPPFFIYPGRFL